MCVQYLSPKLWLCICIAPKGLRISLKCTNEQLKKNLGSFISWWHARKNSPINIVKWRENELQRVEVVSCTFSMSQEHKNTLKQQYSFKQPISNDNLIWLCLYEIFKQNPLATKILLQLLFRQKFSLITVKIEKCISCPRST